ncbi:MAG TPA: proton-conducting transporter membrane subunit [Nitrososphaerales archaeon]|nr:proton-conducting transporter membrane subunit [Nitrososphaerales archaeon]
MTAVPFVLLQTVLVPLLAALLSFALGGSLGRRTGWVAFAALAYVSLLLLSVGAGLYGGGQPVTESYAWAPAAGLAFGFLADGLSLPVALVMSLVCAASAVFSMPYMKKRLEVLNGEGKGRQYGIYNMSFLLVAAGLFGVALSTNLIELYLFVELVLIPTFFLLGLFGYVQKGRVAIMYFVWNQLGAFIFLVGVLVAYSSTGSFAVSSLSTLGTGSSLPYWVFFLVMLGWFVKMGVFGVHMWLPTAEAEPPSSFAPIMAAVVGVGNYVVARLLVQNMPTIFQTFSVPFMIVALLTMIFGGAMTLVQDDVKYLFAWSTMSQNAYSLLGIGSLTVLGLSGGVFYMLSHILGKCILFSVAGILLVRTGTRDIRQMGGLASKMPLTATLCLIGGLVLSAVPPTSGFQAEWIMFAGIFSQGAQGSSAYLAVAFLGIIATLLTVAYTFWPIKKIFFGPLASGLEDVKDAPLTMTVPLLALAVASILIGIYPDIITKFLTNFTGLLGIGGIG